VNARRGLFRLWIVGSAIWIVGWSIYVWNTCWAAADAKDPFVICRTSLFSGGMREVRAFNLSDYVDLAVSVFLIPVGTLVGGLIIAWIVVGFKRASS
jgi:hypothetical protein